MRWARLLRELGHRVDVANDFKQQRPDLLIALHARRSHAAMAAWRQRRGDAPLILALTGTDLYGDIRTDATAQQALEWADRFIVLQEAGVEELAPSFRPRVHVIVQSVTPPRGQFNPRRGVFEVCVLGHLREVKDPFRTAAAARLLAASSRIRVAHAGAAMSAAMQQQAEREVAENPRYRWLGELPRWRALRLLARSRALILTSVMEGGANVISEALACGVPVISSHIPGSVGLLGTDYPGYFQVGDTAGLARQLQRLESDVSFYERLRTCIMARAETVDPATERQRLGELIAEF